MRTLRKSALLRLASLVSAVSLSVGGAHFFAHQMEQYADRYPLLLEESQPLLSTRDSAPQHQIVGHSNASRLAVDY